VISPAAPTCKPGQDNLFVLSAADVAGVIEVEGVDFPPASRYYQLRTEETLP
jgi:hypothetical protein